MSSRLYRSVAVAVKKNLYAQSRRTIYNIVCHRYRIGVGIPKTERRRFRFAKRRKLMREVPKNGSF
jgi:hypothetical protein